MTGEDIYMDKALNLAQKASVAGEVPIGALLVIQDHEIGSSNEREKKNNPMGHAEIDVIQQASLQLGTWRLNGSVLYVTVEPCLMCTGVLYAARVSKVVYGCRNPKGGALEYIQAREKELGLNHSIEIVSGVMATQAANLLQAFFKKKRAS